MKNNDDELSIRELAEKYNDKILTYEEFLKTPLAKETEMSKEDVEYYNNL